GSAPTPEAKGVGALCLPGAPTRTPPRRVLDAAGDGQGGGGERDRLLPDQPPRFAGGLDRCLLDRRDRGVELLNGGGGDGDEAGVAQHPVPGGQVGFLAQHVLVLGGLGGVLDLADLRPLGAVADVFHLLLADVAGGLVGSARG